MSNNGNIVIENSITNPASNPKFWIDNTSPLSFFDFLKNIKAEATPREFNNSYNSYLQAWYKKKGSVSSEIANKVRDQYLSLFNEISLNYTTSEEKRFLSNINYNDEQDLLIAIPFFSKKLSNICQFYIKKRERVKNKIQSNKYRGTEIGLEKTISGIILDYIFIDSNDDTYSTASISLSSIAQNLEIEIEELYDIYSEYFNIDSNLDAINYDSSSEIREQFFSANSNSIDYDIFLDFDKSLKNNIFSQPITIDGLGDALQINYSPDFIDLVCSPDNPLEQFIDENSAPVDERLNLKKKLLEKYIGTDIYYLSTNSTGTDFLSGVLFRAANPSKNLLNRRFPGTASVPSNKLKSPRDIGLFFKPDKLGVLHFKTNVSNYKIRTSNLDPNKIYIYPDPEIYGNVSNITNEPYDYPLYFVVDNSPYKKNNSYSFSIGDIYSTPNDQLFYGYKSYNNSLNLTNESNLQKSFTSLFDKGIISDWKEDIYGNQYGLIKHTASKVLSTISPEIFSADEKKYIVLDGHDFYDDLEGYSFNYSVSSGLTFDGSIRTGVSARCIDEAPHDGNYDTGYSFLSSSMFELTASPIRTLYFREFDPYIEALYGRSLEVLKKRGKILDGAVFTFDGGTIVDPISAGSVLYNTSYKSINTYYTTLIEAGSNPANPLLPAPDGTASFYSTPPLSAAIAKVYDGGSFLVEIVIDNDYPFVNSIFDYDQSTNAFSSTTLEPTSGNSLLPTVQEIDNLAGTVFVKNLSTNNVYPLSSELYNVYRKYPENIKSEIYSNVKWLDVNNTSIFLMTDNYFIIDKINYSNGEFVSPATTTLYYNVSSNSEFNRIGYPFYRPDIDKTYFVITQLLSSLSASNSKTIYPEIYEYDIDTNKSTKIFPNRTTTESDLQDYFSLSSLENINIIRIKRPSLTYSSRNNIFSITYVGEDGNSSGYLFNIKFTYANNAVEIKSSKIYKLSNNIFTHNFNEDLDSTLILSNIAGISSTQTQPTGEFIFN